MNYENDKFSFLFFFFVLFRFCLFVCLLKTHTHLYPTLTSVPTTNNQIEPL